MSKNNHRVIYMSSSYSSYYSKKYPEYTSNYNYINPPKCIPEITTPQSACCVNPIIIDPCFNIIVQCNNFIDKKSNYFGNEFLYYQQLGYYTEDGMFYNKEVSVPGPPTNVIATKVSGTSISVAWSAPSNNGGLNIQYYTIITNSGVSQKQVSANAPLTYTFTGLTSGSYVFTVIAANSAGNSSQSSPSNKITL